MTTDLALVATADEIADLAPADRAAMVTHALVESKSWLAVATKGTDPTPIAEFKAWAATVAEMTRQKGLAAEIQADALEMVRRAERGIGVAVRNGQEAGQIATRRGYHDGPLDSYDGVTDIRTVESATGMTRQSLASEIYPSVDGVSDEQFEAALTDARANGGLSRNNVQRHLGKEPRGRDPQLRTRTRDQLAEEIAALASGGHASAQIARKVGVGEEWVRKTARDFGIDIPADRVVGKTRRIDSIRVARETVTTLDGISATVDLVTDLSGLDPREAQQWTASLTESIRALSRLKKRIEAVQ